MWEAIPTPFCFDPFCTSSRVPQTACIAKILNDKVTVLITADCYEMSDFSHMLHLFTQYMDDSQPGEEYHILLIHNNEIICYDPIRIFLYELYPLPIQVKYMFTDIELMFRYEWLRFQITDPVKDAQKIALLSGDAFWKEYHNKYCSNNIKYILFPNTGMFENNTKTNNILLSEAVDYFKDKQWHTWSDILNCRQYYVFTKFQRGTIDTFLKFMAKKHADEKAMTQNTMVL